MSSLCLRVIWHGCFGGLPASRWGGDAGLEVDEKLSHGPSASRLCDRDLGSVPLRACSKPSAPVLVSLVREFISQYIVREFGV